jgi:hypothetical protein
VTIHGLPVIGRVKSLAHNEGDVVLVRREFQDGSVEFVTGIVNSNQKHPEEWFWGNYFHGAHREQDARQDFITR